MENFQIIKKLFRKIINKTIKSRYKDFIHSVERVITVSIDRKEGVKIALKKDQIELICK